MRRILIVSGLLLFTCSAFGQVTTATITGRITDPGKAVIEGAKVAAIDMGTNIRYENATDSTGDYTIPSLPPSTYKIEVQKPGFKTIIKPDVVLNVQQVVAFNFEMAVGSTSEQVTVQAGVQEVETQESTMSALVDQSQMRDLPLNGRNFQQLILLAPGVQPVPQGISNNNYGRAESYASGGARPEGEEFLLDGTDIANYSGHGAGGGILGTSMGVDAISEFSVLTNTYSAEFGGSGTAINATTRSGTNRFHGSAFDFLRNSWFDARNYFDPLTGPPPFRRNQFGGTFGGPIKKDRTFFFVDYEGLRQQLGESEKATVPNANTRAGYLPCSSAPKYTCITSGTYSGLAYVGVNASTAPLLALYPSLPANALVAAAGTVYLSTVGNNPINENYVIARIDQTISQKDSLFGSVVVDRGTLTDPFPGLANGGQIPLWPESDISHNIYLTLEEKRVVSANLINIVRFSFTRTNAQANDPSTASAINMYPGEKQPDTPIIVTGLTRLGPGNVEPLIQVQNKFTGADDLYWSHGKHDIRAGFSIQRQQDNSSGAGYGQGTWTFQSLLQLLTDTPFEFVGPLPYKLNAVRYYRELDFAGYFQDNWKVMQKLTLNLGLRYEPNTDPVGWAAGGASLETIIHPLTDTAYSPVRHLAESNASLRNFDPRIGLSYAPFPNQKTVIRAGFGMFHDQLREFLYNGVYGQAPPFTAYTFMGVPFPNAFTGTGTSAAKPSQGGGGISYLDDSDPYYIQYNLNVQRQLSSGLVFTVGYVGGHGVHQVAANDQNPVVAETVNGVLTFPAATNRLNNNFGYVEEALGTGTSNYNGLQLSLTGKILNSLQARLYYTFAKNMDDASNGIGGESVNGSAEQTNPYNIKADYGLSSYDVRNNFTGSLLYDLPLQKNRWLGGFQLSTILSAHSGTPYSANVGFDIAHQGNPVNAERPNVVGDPNVAGAVAGNPGCAAPTSIHNATHWFNPCAFAIPTSGTLGNEQRNSLIGPGAFEFDTALLRTIPISETLKAELRAEGFNIINRTNFNLPTNLGVFSATSTSATPLGSAGSLGTTDGTSRQWQFSLKFIF